MIEPPDMYASFVWVEISAQSSDFIGSSDSELLPDLSIISLFLHFQPPKVMNESECFNKLVDPVPETYIGLEPDGLYKECRQVNR